MAIAINLGFVTEWRGRGGGEGFKVPRPDRLWRFTMCLPLNSLLGLILVHITHLLEACGGIAWRESEGGKGGAGVIMWHLPKYDPQLPRTLLKTERRSYSYSK